MLLEIAKYSVAKRQW